LNAVAATRIQVHSVKPPPAETQRPPRDPKSRDQGSDRVNAGPSGSGRGTVTLRPALLHWQVQAQGQWPRRLGPGAGQPHWAESLRLS
jgi:hypothetical protein